MKTRQLTKEELIKKIKALEEIYAKNLKLKMYEACNSNMELIHKYEYALKDLNKGA
jgi:hypothetical protein|tara:strand:+ start:1598 stop:1765 length:168 start_codon:yes stop_codon:yes gene_type:complete